MTQKITVNTDKSLLVEIQITVRDDNKSLLEIAVSDEMESLLVKIPNHC